MNKAEFGGSKNNESSLDTHYQEIVKDTILLNKAGIREKIVSSIEISRMTCMSPTDLYYSVFFHLESRGEFEGSLIAPSLVILYPLEKSSKYESLRVTLGEHGFLTSGDNRLSKEDLDQMKEVSKTRSHVPNSFSVIALEKRGQDN